VSDSPINALRGAAQKARLIASQHRQANRGADPADTAIAKRGDDLERAAREASAELTSAQTAMRADAVVRRREERQAHDAALQSRLRADAQARSAHGRQQP